MWVIVSPPSCLSLIFLLDVQLIREALHAQTYQKHLSSYELSRRYGYATDAESTSRNDTLRRSPRPRLRVLPTPPSRTALDDSLETIVDPA